MNCLYGRTWPTRNAPCFLSRRISSRSRPETRAADVIVNNIPHYDERHEAKLRSKASPESLISLESLENEFRAEVAGALGRMDRKLCSKIDIMNQANDAIANALKEPIRNVPKLKELVAHFNFAQQEAYDARFDLIVQRQSAGFSIDNSLLLIKRYPIPLPKKVKE